MHIQIDDIEPRSKKMSGTERDKFQTVVAEQLASVKRSTFMGDVALKLDLATTSKNAPQAHTIAKNLLDLLSQRRPGVQWPRRHLLYKDDQQIQALSVSCRHGENNPRIYIEARPFSAMLDDLELAAKAVDIAQTNNYDRYREEEQDNEWIDKLRDLLQDEASERQLLGDEVYDAYLKLTRRSAQRVLLGRSRVSISFLCFLYGLPKSIHASFNDDMWANLVGTSKLRLQVGELPITTGGSDVFKQVILDEIDTFKRRWDWIINPLVVAVALEVIVRPNPATPVAVLHDLDNIVRDYLLPGIVPSFGTVSDHRWTIDFNELQQKHPELAASWGRSPMPPPGTKMGVTRYEVWRLPAVEGKPGFVSVALVADMDAKGDLMDDIDRNIGTWADSVERNRRYW